MKAQLVLQDMTFLQELTLPDGDDVTVLLSPDRTRTFVYHSHRGKYPNKVVTYVESHHVRLHDHSLIKTGDPDTFKQIEDRNGEVCLSYCRTCKKGEGELGLFCGGAS